MAAVLERIRERFTKRRDEEQAAVVAGYRDLVRMIADGQDVDEATVDAVLSTHESRPGATCPTNPEHRNLRRVSGGDDGFRAHPFGAGDPDRGRMVVCDDCGATFPHDGPLRAEPSPDGRKTLADLERDVRTLTRRRELAAEIARRPEVQARLNDAKSQIAAAEQRVRDARAEWERLAAELSVPSILNELRILDAAAAELVKTADDPALLARAQELKARQREITVRLQAIKDDLDGYSKERETFKDPITGTTGSKVLGLQRRMEKLQGRSLKPAEQRELEKAQRHFTDLWDRDVQPQIDERERLEPELQEVLAELAEIEGRKLAVE